ncbi:MAG: hypothetical protein ACI4FX_03515 [Agathobacter sp.]
MQRRTFAEGKFSWSDVQENVSGLLKGGLTCSVGPLPKANFHGPMNPAHLGIESDN